MSTFKKTKVVLLPTNEKANLLLTGRNDLYYSSKLSDFLLKEDIDRFQHLYFLSDEEIKEGDWGISKLNEIVQFKKNYESTLYKKIIATTDKSLEVVSKGINPVYEQLPQPSQSFIEKFVEQYNKENQITEVMVEYEYSYRKNDDGEDIGFKVHEPLMLKINPKDNTITIRKVKDSWSTEEMRQKLNDYRMYAKNSNLSIEMFDKWIEENL